MKLYNIKVRKCIFLNQVDVCVWGAHVPEAEWLYIAVAFGSIIVVLIAFFMMRIEKRSATGKSVDVPRLELERPLPFKVTRSITQTEAEEAKNKVRILSLEREILSYAIRRLYEAQAEGVINEEERDRLAEKYKEDMRRINEDISRGESVIALNELEKMQGDLLKLFSERFEELGKKVDEMRVRSGLEVIEPLVEVERERPAEAGPSGAPTAVRETRRREAAEKKPAAAPEKSGAERKIEQIMAEVEKVLARLEQMEASE